MLGNRVNDLEARLATQGKLLAERDYENKQLRQANEAAERTAGELRTEIAALGGGGKSPAFEKLRTEKAAVEEQLRIARDERARLQRQYPNAAFAGYQFGENLANHLAAADVMVFPSRTDTFGLVNLEAMACGVPVAAYPVTGPIDVIEDGVTGALDVDLAAAALRALNVDPAACRARALKSGWDMSSREFENNLVPCRDVAAGQFRVAWNIPERCAWPRASRS